MDGFNKHFFSKLNGRTGLLSLEETTYLKSKKKTNISTVQFLKYAKILLFLMFSSPNKPSFWLKMYQSTLHVQSYFTFKFREKYTFTYVQSFLYNLQKNKYLHTYLFDIWRKNIKRFVHKKNISGGLKIIGLMIFVTL